MRRQISWWLRGRVHTQAALDDHADAIRDLQQRVAELTEAVTRIDPIARAGEQLPDEMRAAIDDLGSRIGALARRLDEERS